MSTTNTTADVEARVDRLELAIRHIVVCISDGNPASLTRSIAAGVTGSYLVEIAEAMDAERQAREAAGT
jgi:hypothetical protein